MSTDRSAYMRNWHLENPRDRTEYHRKYRASVKKEVLSYYGINGVAQCCWTRCNVSDIDMLSLDHIRNDGNKDRERTGIVGGYFLYLKLRKEGYPKGFQTLCCNHQLKKALVWLRKKSKSNVKSTSCRRRTTTEANPIRPASHRSVVSRIIY